jgi:16S rRNA (uracil1498-N3)-methyltransferase
MRIPRVFTHQALIPNSTLALAESQSHYLSKVLRMQAGRELILFNGEGGEYSAEISAVQKKHVEVSVRAHGLGTAKSH